MTKKFFDISAPKQMARAKEEKITPVYQEKESKKSVFKLGLILVILISAGTFSYFYFSKAEVEILPETKNVNFKTEVKIDKRTGEAGYIPGKFIEEENESSMEFPASGIIEKKDFARGKIRVNNKSQRAITLIKNTRFLSDERKQFHSLKEITVPAKGFLDGVDVEADGPGDEYNIGPSKFSVPNLRKYSSELFYNIWAESFLPIAGGFFGKSSRVTEEDLKNAERTLSEKLFGAGKESLKTSSAEDDVLLDELLKQEIIEKFPLAQAGQELKSFVFKAKIKSTGFTFKKADLAKFAKDHIHSQTEGNKKIVEKSLNLNYSVKEKDLEQGKAVLFLEISADIYSEPDFQNLREKIKGESAIEGEYFLEKEQGISKAKIKLWPFWVKRVPQNDEKIEILLRVD
jgi:hypothetical protein